MPHPENNELVTAWRALSGNDEDEGWRLIAISTAGNHRLLAARQFPANNEALLVGFDTVTLPSALQLPSGSGFRVEQVITGQPGNWLALIRQPQGSFDMFSRMSADIVSSIGSHRLISEQRMLQLFIGRIKAWQHFMSRTSGALGPEAELGLAGELHCVGVLIDAGVPLHTVIEGWQGPYDGLQDFELGGGAVEVKTTLSPFGFPAKILSLEQLDDTVRSPLYLCGCRFVLSDVGHTLPERIVRLRELLAADTGALALFDSALLHAGYNDTDAQYYTRAFVAAEVRFQRVSETFPRLTPGTVPAGIRMARYEIDLDAVTERHSPVAEVLETIGVV